MKIIGELKQNGTPSPDNAVEIENDIYLIKDGKKIKLERTDVIRLLEYELKVATEKEKTADELFEELGFLKVKDTETEVQYDYDARIMGDRCTHTILICKIGKIVFSKYKTTNESMGIGMQELKAINKKKWRNYGWNK